MERFPGRINCFLGKVFEIQALNADLFGGKAQLKSDLSQAVCGVLFAPAEAYAVCSTKDNHLAIGFVTRLLF